jgi:hypothetical protein
MSVQSLIRQAQEAGVELRLVDGKVRASGTRAAVTSMLEPLRKHRAELIEAMTDWRVLDKAYQLHHWTCATCRAAGQGYGLRCGTGAALWTRYEALT